MVTLCLFLLLNTNNGKGKVIYQIFLCLAFPQIAVEGILQVIHLDTTRNESSRKSDSVAQLYKLQQSAAMTKPTENRTENVT